MSNGRFIMPKASAPSQQMFEMHPMNTNYDDDKMRYPRPSTYLFWSVINTLCCVCSVPRLVN